MKERYIILFELFGKKMKTEITAISEDQAKSILMSKIIFHKIEVKKYQDTPADGGMVDRLKNMFNM